MSLWRGMKIVLLGVTLLGVPSGASANEIMVSMQSQSGDSETYVNLRGGVSGPMTRGRPTLCLELSPWGPLSVEACGMGAGFLQGRPGLELTHLRGRWTAHVWRFGTSRLEVKPGLGVGDFPTSGVLPGFGPVNSGRGMMTLEGPEASVSLQWFQNFFSGMELVGDLNAGLGWFWDASEFQTAPERLQPFVELSLGVGW